MHDAYYAALRELIQPTRAVDYAQLQTLEPMRELMRELGDPQMRYQSVVVAGSVGKTSMCHRVVADLQTMKRRVGLYTSPHLHSFRERFVLNGNHISMGEFVEIWTEVKAAIQRTKHLYSTFEAATALCLLWFAQKKVDWAVLEIGLGGRFDAVNVVSNKLAIITPIEMEHAAILGGTLESIAWHKAGVMQPNGQAYIMRQQPQALAVLLREAQAQHTQLTHELYIDYPPASAVPAGRLEHAEYRKRLLIIDGAHTVSSAKRLADQLKGLKMTDIWIVIGMLRDKSVAEVLSVFDQHGWHLILTTPDASRALPAAELAERYTPTRASSEIAHYSIWAFNKLAVGAATVRVVTGSLRTAATAREYFGLVSPELADEAYWTRQIYDEKNAML